jgi:hypothetical protein
MSRARLALLGPLAAALALSACGGSSGSPSKASAADNALKFSRCMREHGLKDFPDPQVSGAGVKLTFRSGGPNGPSPQTMERAQNACKHFRAAGEQKLTPQEKVAREEQVRKFASCMRQHGVEVHASSAGGGMQMKVERGGAAGPNPESPTFQAAQKACQGLLPFKGGGPGGGPSTGSAKGGGGQGPGLTLGG